MAAATTAKAMIFSMSTLDHSLDPRSNWVPVSKYFNSAFASGIERRQESRHALAPIGQEAQPAAAACGVAVGQIGSKMPQTGTYTQAALLLGAKRSFRMGMAGWKRISGRAAVAAILEELPVICSLAVAAVSMITIGIMLFQDWPQ
jgi:hypothetical protein